MEAGLRDLRVGEDVLVLTWLHRVHIAEIATPAHIRVLDLEAVDGTPILDVKPVLDRTLDR